MPTTWTARKTGNYSAPGTWSKGSLYAVQSIVAASKTVVVTGDASALAGQTVTLLGTTASDGNYTVTTAVHTTTTLLTMTLIGNLVNQAGAAGNAYLNGTPAAGDTADLNGLSIALNVATANAVTIEDLATGGALTFPAPLAVNSIQSIGPWPVGSVAVGPMPIGSASLGGMPVI